MGLIVPRIDDRGYDAILQEALARIPVHTPEWTNHNDSDPGVTLLQLFAFMTESLLYRANLVPERNRWKFLQLLGVPLRPAVAAQGVVTIANERGPMQTVTLPARLSVVAGRVGFVTGNALDILPVEGKVYYRRALTDAEVADAKATYDQLFGSFTDDTTVAEFYETTPFDPPRSAAVIPTLDLAGTQTVDRAIWIALLARPGEQDSLQALREQIAGKTLTLGLMPALVDASRVIHPGGTQASEAAAPLSYAISTGRRTSTDDPLYLPLDARVDANPLEDLALVQLTLPATPGDIGWWDQLDPTEEGVGDLPPSLDDERLRVRLLAWVRVRIQPPREGTTASGTKARFSWAGINAARVSQRVDVGVELVGTGSGVPDQTFRLVNPPVLRDTVSVVVGGEPYTRVDDLLAAPPEVPVADPMLPPGSPAQTPGDPRVFLVDADSNEIRFGDGLRGKRPPADAQVLASYAYGGGRVGNVGIGELKTSPSLPAGFRVSNPLPTWGGADGETVIEAERAIPRVLRNANRAVAEDDFADIVRRAPGVDVGRVEILPLFHPDAGSPAPGVVTVLVIPVDPAQPDAPVPDQLFLRAVCRYLEPRRVLTTELHVRGPIYVGIVVSVGVDVVPGRDVADVRERVRAGVRDYLSPLTGGVERTGWPLGKSVEDRELLVQAARVDGVAKVRQVLMWDMSGAPQTTIPISGLQLPRLDRLGIASGDADDLSVTTTATGGPTTPPVRRLPVPVIPRQC